MIKYRRYLKYVFEHKYYVFKWCLKLKVPFLSAILHDWDKFTPLMMVSYANTFRDDNGKKQYIPHKDFDKAWNRHQKINKHHWQYWVLVKDSGEMIAIEVPNRHKREMLADWIGAGIAINGKIDIKNWYSKNKEKIILHDNTRFWIENKINEIG